MGQFLYYQLFIKYLGGSVNRNFPGQAVTAAGENIDFPAVIRYGKQVFDSLPNYYGSFKLAARLVLRGPGSGRL
jgi:hypothetical protein